MFLNLLCIERQASGLLTGVKHLVTFSDEEGPFSMIHGARSEKAEGIQHASDGGAASPEEVGPMVDDELLLVTPMRNEAEHIHDLIGTVLRQTIRPAAWILVDGNSDDGCSERARNLTEQYDWIHVIEQTGYYGAGYSHQNFALGVNDGVRHGLEMPGMGNRIRYIAKIDASVELAPDFLERMTADIRSDQRTAFVCGLEVDVEAPDTIYHSGDPFVDLNDIRAYRRDFLVSQNLYPVSASPDAVLIVKAMNEGLDARLCSSARFHDKRAGATKIGRWKGYLLKGRALWNLGYHPLIIFADIFYFGLLRKPRYQFTVVMFGYLQGFINQDERIPDPEVVDYFWRRRLADAMDAHLKRG